MIEILNLKDSEFETEVLGSEKPVLVDFWASWCMPCKMQGEILHALAENTDSDVKICKINVDEEEKTAYKYRIESIPTLLIFKGGELKEKFVGVTSAQELEAAIEKTAAL